MDSGNYSLNACAFDKSGTMIATASDDGFVRLFDEKSRKNEANLKGHEDAV